MERNFFDKFYGFGNIAVMKRRKREIFRKIKFR